jgi:hypothetical protein
VLADGTVARLVAVDNADLHGLELWAVRGLAGREHERQWQPSGVDHGVDLAAQPAPGPAEPGRLRPRRAAPPEGGTILIGSAKEGADANLVSQIEERQGDQHGGRLQRLPEEHVAALCWVGPPLSSRAQAAPADGASPTRRHAGCLVDCGE